MLVRVKQDGECHPSLTRGCIYYVLGIEADTYRLINDHGDLCLYEPEMFEVVDPREPGDWVSERGEEGERYAYPLPLNRMGFFEDYHNRDPQAVTEFWLYVNRMMASR